VTPDTGPNLLIEWSSPWQEFRSAIGPAMGRSPARLAGEARTGLVPLRGMLLCWGTQAIFIVGFIWLSAHLPSMQPFVPRTPSRVDVIYFSPDELPPVQDLGGAAAGHTGRAGGKEVHHRSQAIRVARGSAATEKVVDAPNLKLPISNAPVANLLAFKSNLGPPPAEGLKSSRTAPTLSKDALLAPPPEVLRDRTRATPGLSSTIIAPPPTTQRSRQTMGLSTTIIAPAPQDVPRDQSHSVIAMSSSIIQPAPDVPRDPPPLRGPAAASTTVVPPPVSAPPRDPFSSTKLSLPSAGVIAPPPSQVTRDLRTSGASLADPKVVPPPVQLGGRSSDKHAMQGLVGANQVVPPPPSVTNGTSLSGGGSGHNDRPGGFGTTLTADNVVPPPPGVSRDTAFSGSGRGGATSLGGNVVVPPPPNLSSAGGSLSGRGTGSKGGGLGGALDLGSSVVAPPTSGGSNANGTGVVVSNQPGSAKGIPGNGAPGAIAMSPAGTAKTGTGGSGDGNGIGRGNGPGSGLTGEGSGAAKAGAGRGSDPNARGGTSPYPGTGGTGSGTSGQPAVPGVNVSGGSTAAIVNLPSFGSDGNDPGSMPGRSGPGDGHGAFNVMVEGTSRAGGAFNFYGLLKGDKVYTIYLDTMDGRVEMEFADVSSTAGHHDLRPPEAIRTHLQAGLTTHSFLAIACVLDRSGTLQNMHVLKADTGAPTSRVIAALHTWKFKPAFRGDEPVEVNAILGFNVSTN
jgi:hypothetical protein